MQKDPKSSSLASQMGCDTISENGTAILGLERQECQQRSHMYAWGK